MDSPLSITYHCLMTRALSLSTLEIKTAKNCFRLISVWLEFVAFEFQLINATNISFQISRAYLNVPTHRKFEWTYPSCELMHTKRQWNCAKNPLIATQRPDFGVVLVSKTNQLILIMNNFFLFWDLTKCVHKHVISVSHRVFHFQWEFDHSAIMSYL